MGEDAAVEARRVPAQGRRAAEGKRQGGSDVPVQRTSLHCTARAADLPLSRGYCSPLYECCDCAHAWSGAMEAVAVTDNIMAECPHAEPSQCVPLSQPVAETLVKEVAKPAKDSLTEVVRSGDFLSYTAEEGVRFLGEGNLLASDSFPGQDRTKLALVQKVGSTVASTTDTEEACRRVEEGERGRFNLSVSGTFFRWWRRS